MNDERQISSAQIAYRTVLLAAGLLLFGLLFRQLVTLLLAILITIIFAIPLAAAAGDLLDQLRGGLAVADVVDRYRRAVGAQAQRGGPADAGRAAPVGTG